MVPRALVSQVFWDAVQCTFGVGSIETNNAAKEKEITKYFYKM